MCTIKSRSARAVGLITQSVEAAVHWQRLVFCLRKLEEWAGRGQALSRQRDTNIRTIAALVFDARCSAVLYWSSLFFGYPILRLLGHGPMKTINTGAPVYITLSVLYFSISARAISINYTLSLSVHRFPPGQLSYVVASTEPIVARLIKVRMALRASSDLCYRARLLSIHICKANPSATTRPFLEECGAFDNTVLNSHCCCRRDAHRLPYRCARSAARSSSLHERTQP
ncbi:hypothetical protein JB92DRAFT_1751803 [Gautieria morchelliformis]|nr:hypothetical protein JB92DRAFT_1751803 [Gautieria morchelliformis]